MSDLLTEVDEALKQERLEKLWQQYGTAIISLIVAIIAGATIHAGYKSWTSSVNETQTARYLSVMEKPDTHAEDILAISPELQDNLQKLSALYASGIAHENNDEAKALEIYTQNTDINSDDAITALLSYMSILHGSKSNDEKRAALEKITSSETHPWRNHAALESAVLEAREYQNYTKARAYLKTIKMASHTPQTLKQKAQSLDILYALKEKISKQTASN